MSLIARLALAVWLAAAAALGTAHGQEAAGGESQVELTVETARRVLDSVAAIRSTYPGLDLSDTSPEGGFMEAVAAAGHAAVLEAEVGRAGFADVAEWSATVTALAVAAAMLEEGEDPAAIAAQIGELERDDTMPAELKAATIDMLRSMLPSDANLAVARAMLADPAYGDTLRGLVRPAE